MRSSGIRDDVAPWSFFLPVTLAVIVGVLVAGLVERGIDAVFGGGGREDAVAAPAAREDAGTVARPEGSDSRSGPVAEAPPAPAASHAPAAPSPVEAAETVEGGEAALPVLPGAAVARRDGAAEACINGTVALRDDNGWQQRLENDAPVPCVEQSAER